MNVIHRGLRSIHTAVDCPRLTRFALQPPKFVEAEFENGSLYKLSAEYLRIYSPAVDSKIRSIGGKKVARGTLPVFVPVGLFAVPNCRTWSSLASFYWDVLFAI
ncbi:hypothetical protein HAX54_019884 [Datura stramonium]|uniref:Uncharacterized protein n=1 Tax=Datura stramonium TaxID=4076 RepID=A0ABS8S277_DATST|nr:hypothetical protein [Datura stramonium]